MSKYSRIHDEDERSLFHESDNTSHNDDAHHLRWRTLRNHHLGTKCLWLIIGFSWSISIIMAIAITTFAILRIQARNSLGALSSGYSSDFGPARVAASIQQKIFTGSPRFDPQNGEYIPRESPSWRYIGSGPKVDAAWEELSHKRYFLLTDEEAKEAWGDDYTEYWNNQWGGYLGGLDMFHTLHCLDHIRMSFYPEEYVLDGIHGDMHQIHCIDHIRQMIQCNADMTVIPTRWYDSIHQNYIDSDRTHTCRDFGKVREWASSRYSGPSAVKPRHPNGTLWENFRFPE